MLQRGSGRGTGLVLAVASAATFGTSGTFGAALLAAGWTPAAAVTARVAIAALVLTPVALVQLRGRWRLLIANVPVVAVFGLVAIAGCQLFYFNAVAHLAVGVALLLEYLGTVLVVGWLWLRHGQRPRRLTVLGGAVAVAGLVLVLDLAGAHHLDPIGVAWGLTAAGGLAVYFMLSCRCRTRCRRWSWPGAACGSGRPPSCCSTWWAQWLSGRPAPTSCCSITGSAGWCPCSVWRCWPPRSPTSRASAPPGCSAPRWRRSPGCSRCSARCCSPGSCWARCPHRCSSPAGRSSSSASGSSGSTSNPPTG